MTQDKILYTIRGKTDGFGAQYQAIMSGFAYCYYHNYTYIHTPFKQIEHGTDVEKANEFVGFDTDIIDENGLTIFAEEYAMYVHQCSKPSIFYHKDVLDNLRYYYYSTNKPEIENVDIAIHIRRGDVSFNSNCIRFTENDFYKKLIVMLKKKYPTYSITIFSQGKFKDFKNLKLDKKQFRLNDDIFKTFHSLVKAKVLIQSLSSFSYSAGILNENIVYHMDGFWSYKLDGWYSISDLL